MLQKNQVSWKSKKGFKWRKLPISLSVIFHLYPTIFCICCSWYRLGLMFTMLFGMVKKMQHAMPVQIKNLWMREPDVISPPDSSWSSSSAPFAELSISWGIRWICGRNASTTRSWQWCSQSLVSSQHIFSCWTLSWCSFTGSRTPAGCALVTSWRLKKEKNISNYQHQNMDLPTHTWSVRANSFISWYMSFTEWSPLYSFPFSASL